MVARIVGTTRALGGAIHGTPAAVAGTAISLLVVETVLGAGTTTGTLGSTLRTKATRAGVAFALSDVVGDGFRDTERVAGVNAAGEAASIAARASTSAGRAVSTTKALLAAARIGAKFGKGVLIGAEASVILDAGNILAHTVAGADTLGTLTICGIARGGVGSQRAGTSNKHPVSLEPC